MPVVHLSEFPPFVLTVADVEICHLERVQFGLKNFDVVFVLHDFTKAPLHINTVPSAWLVHPAPSLADVAVSQLDNVKDWLDGVDLPYTEGPVNLNVRRCSARLTLTLAVGTDHEDGQR